MILKNKNVIIVIVVIYSSPETNFYWLIGIIQIIPNRGINVTKGRKRQRGRKRGQVRKVKMDDFILVNPLKVFTIKERLSKLHEKHFNMINFNVFVKSLLQYYLANGIHHEELLNKNRYLCIEQDLKCQFCNYEVLTLFIDPNDVSEDLAPYSDMIVDISKEMYGSRYLDNEFAQNASLSKLNIVLADII